jgi:metal-sulfur cluster biosynthetic enzyme
VTEETLAAVTPFDAQKRATELAILDALRSVVDPEIGMNVVELALIRQVLVGETESEVKMILTTPFCPYAGSMLAQVKEAAESVLEHPVKVTLLAERWDPKDAIASRKMMCAPRRTAPSTKQPLHLAWRAPS